MVGLHRVLHVALCCCFVRLFWSLWRLSANMNWFHNTIAVGVALLCAMRIELTSTFVTCIVETTALCCSGSLCNIHVN